jgi:hypothetical protein
MDSWIGYTELTGLFRILQNDVLALFILLVCGWFTGYRLDFDFAPSTDNAIV